jgi:phosphoglycerate dehydrogenase-like enzyme
VLVNVGRGDAIEADALLIVLIAKALAGAALDVTSPELLLAAHALFGVSDVLLTPHLKARTVKYWERAVNVFQANLTQWRAGEEVWNRVDFERGY